MDVNVDNSEIDDFTINKGLYATKSFTAVVVFNPENLTKMEFNTIESDLYQLENFEFATKND